MLKELVSLCELIKLLMKSAVAHSIRSYFCLRLVKI